MDSVKGLILCGGKSSRMGQDKTEVNFRGTSLISHATALFESLQMEYFLSINSNQTELNTNYPCVEDQYKEVGPLGGIVSALETLNSKLLVIPVDMPLLNPNLLKHLLEAQDIHEMVRCFQLNGRPEPFPSIWSAKATSHLKAFIQEGQFSLQKAIARLPHQMIDCNDPELFRNINSPEDL